MAVYTILGPLFACFWPLWCQHIIFLDPKAPPTSPISHQPSTISLYFLLQVDTSHIPFKNYHHLFPNSSWFPLEKSFFWCFAIAVFTSQKGNPTLFGPPEGSVSPCSITCSQALQHTIGILAGHHCQLITFPYSLCLICGSWVLLFSSLDCLYQLEQAYKL